MNIDLRQGDCRDVLTGMEAGSVDTVITDPPYGLEFMGKGWDRGVPGVEFWSGVRRVCKPGAMMLAFGGTRTHHRLMVAVEDAGWEIRDCMMWLYGSGLPKSLDVGKAIDRANGVEREKITNPLAKKQTASINSTDYGDYNAVNHISPIPATAAAKEWDGWGTALKPAWEIIICAQNPIDNKTEPNTITGNLLKKEAQLWSMLPVKIAEMDFGLSHQDFAAVSSFARWDVSERESIQADLFGAMDTSRYASVINTCLSIVTLWRVAWAEHLKNQNTSTTETETSPTIDPKIWNSCLSELTPRSIIKAEIDQPGSRLNVYPAARFLNAASRSIIDIRDASVLANAILTDPEKCPDDQGLGLKPDYRPIIVAMNPIQGTYAENAQSQGVAGLWIDGARIRTEEKLSFGSREIGDGIKYNPISQDRMTEGVQNPSGRWPANVILDDEAAEMVDDQSGVRTSGGGDKHGRKSSLFCDSISWENLKGTSVGGDSGGASRFFYTAKASSVERGPGNIHPTLKPVDLMAYLARLTRTPSGGVVLDPFMGSGSTGVGCVREERDFIGIELEDEYFKIAEERIRSAEKGLTVKESRSGQGSIFE